MCNNRLQPDLSCRKVSNFKGSPQKFYAAKFSYDNKQDSYYMRLEFAQEGLGQVRITDYLSSNVVGLKTIEITENNETVFSHRAVIFSGKTMLDYAVYHDLF